MYRILMIVYLGSVLDRRAIYLSDARVAAAPLCLLLFQLKNPDFFSLSFKETLEQINLVRSRRFSK